MSTRIYAGVRSRAEALRRQATLAFAGNPSPPAQAAPNVIVALTSFPARASRVHHAIRSILDQELQAERVVLYLAEDQFPGRRLPRGLTSLRESCLDVRFVADMRSYKKLLPALVDFPSSTIVTADDDVLYPRTWLSDLYRVHSTHPRDIVAHRATRMTYSSPRAFASYAEWPNADASGDPHLTFATGSGGILYPPGSLSPSVLDYGLAEKLAPTADDIWFKAMGLLNETGTRKVSNERVDFPSVLGTQRVSLRELNVGSGRNVAQATAVWDHFNLWDRAASGAGFA